MWYVLSQNLTPYSYVIIGRSFPLGNIEIDVT